MSNKKHVEMTAEDLQYQYEYMVKVKNILQHRYPHPPMAHVHSL